MAMFVCGVLFCLPGFVARNNALCIPPRGPCAWPCSSVVFSFAGPRCTIQPTYRLRFLSMVGLIAPSTRKQIGEAS